MAHNNRVWDPLRRSISAGSPHNRQVVAPSEYLAPGLYRAALAGREVHLLNSQTP